MKVLITGFNGFVGGYLIDEVQSYFNKTEQSFKIFGTYNVKNDLLNNKKIYKTYYLDITDKDSVYDVLNEIKPDYIFHLAAQSSVSVSWKKPQLTFDVNVVGTLNILEAIKIINPNCKILLIGSSDEYGKVENCSINETYQLNPQSVYAISKVTEEQLGKLYSKAYNMNIVMTRSFNHIGPGQAPVFAVSDWAKQIAEIEKGLKKPIIYVGDINVTRDFTNVTDIVKAYVKLIDCGVKGEIYNVGSGNEYTLKYILDVLLSYSKVSIEIKIDESKIRPVENRIIKCDNTKINKLCGWKQEVDINNTLLSVLQYWRGNI